MWMRHEATAAVADLPDLQAWRALGWEQCDPPVEADPTSEPEQVEINRSEIAAAVTAALKPRRAKRNNG